jgi:hypothetical protein
MTNQEIVDEVDYASPSLPYGLREKILDAVWQVLNDNRADEETKENQ